MNGLLPAQLGALPPPEAAAAAHCLRVQERITGEIAAAGGWLSFARYMELALHAPGLGYYSAGAHKLGDAGDFTTAPEMGDIFGRTLARQADEILRLGVEDILEVGPGSGALACSLLRELKTLAMLPRKYFLLETSADLRDRQRALLKRELPEFASRIVWLEALPSSLNALIIANEVLDVLPVHLVRVREEGIDELGVSVADGTFVWSARPAHDELHAAAAALQLAPGYTAEISFAVPAFIRALSQALSRGVALLIDYGFPAAEYYHPQRHTGTLMCHYRHRAHPDPLVLAGLQDITAHVDFSRVAGAAVSAGCALLGYTNQARFLINCGITDVLATLAPDNSAYLPLAAAAQTLLSPAEMGELFKVIAFGKNIGAPLTGFSQGDKRHTL